MMTQRADASATNHRLRGHPSWKGVGVSEPSDEDLELAQRLYDEWDQGQGTSKSQLEIRTWGDSTSHGRRFDRFVGGALGVSTSKPSKQTDRIGALESQIKRLGAAPVGSALSTTELQLQHAREAALQAIRGWNDPLARFRTGSFALLFVTAWNSLAIAATERDGGDWRIRDKGGAVVLGRDGDELARDTLDIVAEAFQADEQRGLRENVRFWVDLRNCVAHRYVPALDTTVIPHAQAGLLNLEKELVEGFGDDYALGDQLTVPLQLSGFRDPGVLTARKSMYGALPLEVQTLLTRAESEDPDLLRDETFQLRVAFVPVVPSSGRNPDAVAYFIRPGEVPDELGEAIDRYLVLPKVGGATRHTTSLLGSWRRSSAAPATGSTRTTTHASREPSACARQPENKTER